MHKDNKKQVIKHSVAQKQVAYNTHAIGGLL